MRTALAFFLILLTQAANAAYAPVETAPRTPSPDVYAMFTGPAGAMLESDYFRAPRTSERRAIPCRLERSIFDKTRLAQACN
ncbi:MAG: hypothetical protein ACK4UO_14805 [Pseudolabrys sp.]